MKATRSQQPLHFVPSSPMRTPRRYAVSTLYARVAFALAVSLGIAGCGGSGPEFHPVIGSVQLTDGETAVLAGHGIEAMLESDNQVRAYGTIAADGQFFLETLHEGSVRRGALAGKYQARMVLSDDDIETRRLAAAALPKKAFQFDSSGLAFEVPSASPIQLRISK
jgi:hypothetical protein